MITLKATFTDQYYVPHVGAPCAVARANRTAASNETIVLQADDTFFEEAVASDVVDYQICYWYNEMAKDAGAPYLYLDTAGRSAMAFTFKEEGEHKGMTLEEACLHHFENVVLAEIGGSVAE